MDYFVKPGKENMSPVLTNGDSACCVSLCISTNSPTLASCEERSTDLL